MEIGDITVSEMEKIINSYYFSICESNIIKDTIGEPERKFDQIEISEILGESGCTDPYEVPIDAVISKYYEEVTIKYTLENNIDRHIVKLLKSMIRWSTQGNSQCDRLKGDIDMSFKIISRITKSNKGKRMFDEYYSPLKNVYYSKAIQSVLNETYSYTEVVKADTKNINCNLLKSYLENSFTSKIKYPMPKVFDLTKLTVDDLSVFITDNAYDVEVPSIVSRNTDIDSISRITIDEAMSNIPEKEVDTMISAAQRFYKISAARAYM